MVLDDIHKLRSDVDKLQYKAKTLDIDDTVKEVDVEYIVTDSRITVPAQNDPLWSTTVGEVGDDDFVWSRTKLTPLKGKPRYSNPVCITGYSGTDGVDNGFIETGIPYENIYLHVRFCKSNNPHNLEQLHILPQGRMWIGVAKIASSTPPTDLREYDWHIYDEGGFRIGSTNDYLHIRFAYSELGVGLNMFGGGYRGYYVDSYQESSEDPVRYFWHQVKGKSILRLTEEYCQSTSYTVPPVTGWRETVPERQDGMFYWTRTNIQYTDGSNEYTNAICVSGQDGEWVNYVFKRTTNLTPPNAPLNNDTIYTNTNQLPANVNPMDCWWEDPQGVNPIQKYEWVSQRTRNSIGEWEPFQTPSLWARYPDVGEKGEKGEDAVIPDEIQEQINELISNPNDPRLSDELIGKVEDLVSNPLNAVTLNGKTDTSFVDNTVDINQDITLSTSHETTNLTGLGGTIRCSRWGNMVVVEFYEVKCNKSSSGWDTSVTGLIPSKYRPMNNVWAICDFTPTRIRVYSDGKIGLNTSLIDDINNGSPVIGINHTFVYIVQDNLTPTTLTRINNTSIPVGGIIKYRLQAGTTRLQGKQVEFIVNKDKYIRTTDENGEVSLTVNLPVGTYTGDKGVKAKFYSDGQYAACTDSFTLKVIHVSNISFTSEVYNGKRSIKGIVKSGGRPLANIDVELYVDGSLYATKPTIANGTATFDILSLTGTITYRLVAKQSGVLDHDYTIDTQTLITGRGNKSVSLTPETVVQLDDGNEIWTSLDCSKIEAKDNDYISCNVVRYVGANSLVFSGFDVPDDVKKIYVEVVYGVFGASSDSCNYRDISLQLNDLEVKSLDNITDSLYNSWHTCIVSWDNLPGVDNIEIKMVCGMNNASNFCTFGIDLVNVIIEY